MFFGSFSVYVSFFKRENLFKAISNQGLSSFLSPVSLILKQIFLFSLEEANPIRPCFHWPYIHFQPMFCLHLESLAPACRWSREPPSCPRWPTPNSQSGSQASDLSNYFCFASNVQWWEPFVVEGLTVVRGSQPPGGSPGLCPAHLLVRVWEAPKLLTGDPRAAFVPGARRSSCPRRQLALRGFRAAGVWLLTRTAKSSFSWLRFLFVCGFAFCVFAFEAPHISWLVWNRTLVGVFF